MARADGVFSEHERTVAGVPDGEGPIADELGEAVGAPLVVRCCDDGHVRGTRSYRISQLTNQVDAIVQPTIPGDHSAGGGNMRLRFAVRFLRSVESPIEDLDAVLRITLVAVGSKRSECCADFVDVVRSRRLALEIPCSKLDAHDCFPSFPYGDKSCAY